MAVHIGNYRISPNRDAFEALAFLLAVLGWSWMVGVLAFHISNDPPDAPAFVYHFLAVIMGGLLTVGIAVLAALFAVGIWALFDVEYRPDGGEA